MGIAYRKVRAAERAPDGYTPAEWAVVVDGVQRGAVHGSRGHDGRALYFVTIDGVAQVGPGYRRLKAAKAAVLGVFTRVMPPGQRMRGA